MVVVFTYNICLRRSEATKMLVVCCAMKLFGSLNSMLLVRGFTFGLPAKSYAFTSDAVTHSLEQAFRLLSINVLVAKLIPPHIEASMYAIITGIINLSNMFLATQLGNFFNIFVGVKTDQLEDLWILFAIASACVIFPLSFIWLVPSRAEVSSYQRINEFLEKYPPKNQ